MTTLKDQENMDQILRALELATDVIEYGYIDFQVYGFHCDKDIIDHLRQILSKFQTGNEPEEKK